MTQDARIEKAAKAMGEMFGLTWDQLGDYTKKHWLNKAALALEAVEDDSIKLEDYFDILDKQSREVHDDKGDIHVFLPYHIRMLINEIKHLRDQKLALPPGWVAVPEEANSEMIKAGVDYALKSTISGDNKWPDYIAGLYKAMLSAVKP